MTVIHINLHAPVLALVELDACPAAARNLRALASSSFVRSFGRGVPRATTWVGPVGSSAC